MADAVVKEARDGNWVAVVGAEGPLLGEQCPAPQDPVRAHGSSGPGVLPGVFPPWSQRFSEVGPGGDPSSAQ